MNKPSFDTPDRRAGASPRSFASSWITRGKVRSGLFAIGAVNSSARSQALAADRLLTAGVITAALMRYFPRQR